MRKQLNTKKGNIDEQSARISLNLAFKEMQKRGEYNSNTVRNYLLRCACPEDIWHWPGVRMSYEQAVQFFNELNR